MSKRKYCYLAGRLRQLDLTQSDVAAALGLQQSAVSHRFTGRTPWSCTEMYAVLALVQAPPEDLHLYFPADGRTAS